MIFERVKSPGIAHHSYLVGSLNKAVVIDPRRDCGMYIDIAQKHGLQINSIFETHRNEDYAIGSIELNHMTGATIYHGAGLNWKYGTNLHNGQEFGIGNLRLKSIFTPGHTDESVSYVLTDLSTGEEPVMVFSGDTLFVGDTGRIDLYGPDEAQRLASNLYDSIFKLLLPLGDGVLLCPAHGSGSVCGGQIADRDESTLGIEKKQNPALQIKDKEDFIKYKIRERLERPYYFSQMEKYNLEGPPLLGKLPLPVPFSPQEFSQKLRGEYLVVDTREAAGFGGAHIGCTYNILLEGLPVFAGWVLNYEKPILMIMEDEVHVEQAVRYLIRAGFDKIEGFLNGGIHNWCSHGFPIDRTGLLTVFELKDRIDKGERLVVLDTRGESEWDQGHIEGAKNIYVGHLEKKLHEVPMDETIAVICKTSNRSSLATSVLLCHGYKNIFNVLGGMQAWIEAGFPVITDN